MRTLVWFRGKDLRLADHQPLYDAARSGDVIPLFVLDPFFFAAERARQLPHRMQFLLESLRELAQNLERVGSKLLVVAGKSVDIVPQLAAVLKVDRVVAQRWVEPFARERDRRVRAALAVPFELYEGETLVTPGTLRSGAGTPYAVFTPFARAFAQTAQIAKPIAAPKSLPPLPGEVLELARPWLAATPNCEELGITVNPGLVKGGESAAQARLTRFLSGPASRYDVGRDQMGDEGTSRLSQDLKFGTLSVRTLWNRIQQKLGPSTATHSYLNELVWREFAHSTLWDRPELTILPFRSDFIGFPWRYDEADWQAWIHGKTGYPVVDAAARQLLATGFVHNRARMISASFLTKHLLISYRRGEAHYMKYLTDGDLAQNNAGWQWSAGTGCDAQPYFRVFNPVVQGDKFDPEGRYVRRWVPELEKMPQRFIHHPWEAPETVLAQAGVRLGRDYPEPIVEHRYARTRFLALADDYLKRPALALKSKPEPTLRPKKGVAW